MNKIGGVLLCEDKKELLDYAIEQLEFEFQREEALAELARLRAESEAWRAVREERESMAATENESRIRTVHEVDVQIARLDQLKGEVQCDGR